MESNVSNADKLLKRTEHSGAILEETSRVLEKVEKLLGDNDMVDLLKCVLRDYSPAGLISRVNGNVTGLLSDSELVEPENRNGQNGRNGNGNGHCKVDRILIGLISAGYDYEYLAELISMHDPNTEKVTPKELELYCSLRHISLRS